MFIEAHGFFCHLLACLHGPLSTYQTYPNATRPMPPITVIHFFLVFFVLLTRVMYCLFPSVIPHLAINLHIIEPYLKGTTPSTAWVIMYKFWTLPLTVRQIENLIEHPHSVYLRGIGFLYLRYVCKPDQLWDWLGAYLDDDQEIQLQGGVKPVHS